MLPLVFEVFGSWCHGAGAGASHLRSHAPSFGLKTMHAKVLDFVVYESQWKWHSEQVALPTWAQIEEAIRRLDRFHYPLLHLWPTLDKSEHELVEDRQRFSVIGGKGEYWFAATIGGQSETHYLNEQRWRRPTGTSLDERSRLCGR